MLTQKMWREAPRSNFGSSVYVFSPPPGPALCKLGQPGVLFVLPEVLTPVLRPSVSFSRAFPCLVCSHRHFGLLFPVLPTWQFHGDLIRLMAETCQGFIPTCQCQEAPNVSFGNWPEMGKACGPSSPFSVKLFGLFDHFITPWELEVLT